MNTIKVLGFLLLAGCVISSFAADAPRGAIYRWIDAKGVVHYGDRPAPMSDAAKSEAVLNKSDLGGSGEDLAAQRQLAVGLRDDAQKGREAQEKAAAAKAAADKDEERKKVCASVKESVRTLSAGGRVATVNDKGERIILGEEDIQVKLNEANKAVEEACNPPKPAK
jgi:hypothetical protein